MNHDLIKCAEEEIMRYKIKLHYEAFTYDLERMYEKVIADLEDLIAEEILLGDDDE